MTTRFFATFSLLFIALMAFSALAANPSGEKVPVKQQTENMDAATALPSMQKTMGEIKGQVTGENNENTLGELNDLVADLVNQADALSQRLMPQQQQVITQLAVLGPATSDVKEKETADVVQQRNKLSAQKSQLDAQIKQSTSIANNARLLSSQILNLRRDAIKNQLAVNSGSILSKRFWAPLLEAEQTDFRKLGAFIRTLFTAVMVSWQPTWRLGTLSWILVAVLVASIGLNASERFFSWLSMHQLPEGRLRRSFFASVVTASTLVASGLICYLLSFALFIRQDVVVDAIDDFIQRLLELSLFCGLIIGLGRAFLATKHPSWRLIPLTNEVVQALRPYPYIVALLVFLFQAIEMLNSSVGTSVDTTIFANGWTALVISVTTLSAIIRINLARKKVARRRNVTLAHTTLTDLIMLLILLLIGTIIVTLLIGYVALGRFLSYELIWCGVLFSAYYLINCLCVDSIEAFFSTQYATGCAIQRTLNINERYLQQAAVLLIAISRVVLAVFFLLALLNGSFASSTPLELMHKALHFWRGDGLGALKIVPSQFVHALIILIIGSYALSAVRRWLSNTYLPKTAMDNGMRVSIVTLFSNLGYLCLILLALSTLGLHWDKLAWIVSALSVGIGFGLQEIVKNFISGLILLTERPIKVGDLVTISGIEGDVRRINVRATEIQLSDRSTVIVPNSQFIAQNVRNASMGNALGVVTVTLTFPLTLSPPQLRDMLLAIYHDNERILVTPEPTVLFREITTQGVVLSVTGYVASHRQVTSAKSDLLFAIFSRLNKEKIALSMPQTVLVTRAEAVQNSE